MDENSLLALLAKLCGDITSTNNSDTDQLFKLQEAIATALINQQSTVVSHSFQFDQLENFATQHLDAGDLEHLNNVLQRVQSSTQPIDTNIRVFRRETPFISSQLRGSVPDWARGADIINTIGPVVNRDGRRLWFDFYKIIPVVQVWLQGASQPFILLPLEVINRINIFGPRSYKIPAGSVWIHGDIFTTDSPDNLYC